jgi:hypothetical protein
MTNHSAVVESLYKQPTTALLLVFSLGLFFPGAAFAEAPQLGLPVDCKLGQTCFVQNYFDQDPGPGYKDYRCNAHTYNDHRGTDFRLKDLVAMHAGTAVLAAADGTVRAVRDGMPDINVRDIGKAALQGKEAGNSVVIVHDDGWETQYAHLKKGSVAVKPGQKVKRGDALGQVGLSGNTEFPHLHLEVRHAGKPVDPFKGESGAVQCELGAKTLWLPQALASLSYEPTAALGSGFSDHVLSADEINNWQADQHKPDTQSRQLVYWVKLMGPQGGDQESMQLYDPHGAVIAQKQTVIPRDKAEWLSYVGRNVRDGQLPPGNYRGRFVLTRKGREIVVLDTELEVFAAR